MGKWRNTDDSGEGSRPKMSDEQKKKAKEQKAKAAENGGGQPKATVADESRQATAPEKAMLGDWDSTALEAASKAALEKMQNDPKYKEMQALQKQHEATGKKHSGAKQKLNKLINEMGGGSSTQGGKGKGGGKPAQVLPEGANPDEYYTGRWRTGKKPAPEPAPKPPAPDKPNLGDWRKYPALTGPFIPGPNPGLISGGYPIARPIPPGSFPTRGDIGGGPGQFPYPMPMPQPSWPPGGMIGRPYPMPQPQPWPMPYPGSGQIPYPENWFVERGPNIPSLTPPGYTPGPPTGDIMYAQNRYM